MSLASPYFSSGTGSRQSSLCCQTLSLSNLACTEERQKVLFKIYIDSLQRERKRGADWFLRDFFPPVCYSVHLHLIYFWPWHQWVTNDFYVSLPNHQHVAPGDLLVNLCMQLLTIDPRADSRCRRTLALHTWELISQTICVTALDVSLSSQGL